MPDYTDYTDYKIGRSCHATRMYATRVLQCDRISELPPTTYHQIIHLCILCYCGVLVYGISI